MSSEDPLMMFLQTILDMYLTFVVDFIRQIVAAFLF